MLGLSALVILNAHASPGCRPFPCPAAQVGGFDRRYGRGYYEDTDLAMALSAAGLPVMLQPLAVVHHREGGTFGTDETSAPKRVLMERNGRLFAAKWADRLQASRAACERRV